MFLVLSVFSFDYALDDSATSFVDFIPFIATLAALLFAVLTFLIWRKTYVANKSKLSLLFMALPILAIVIYGLCSFITYRKINKPYHLFATLRGDHNYEYYFRDDSTLKIVGHFALTKGQTFQSYRLVSDTIILDTIIPCTGIVAKKYIFSLSYDSAYNLLTPLDNQGEQIDSMSLYIETKNYR